MQVVLDLLGTLFAACSGGLVAVRAGLHIMGGVLLGLVTGLGGGLLRDGLLGATPPVSLTDWRYPAVALGAGLVVQWFHRGTRIQRTIDHADAVWLGFLSVSGALKAQHLGAPPLAGLLMGVCTGIGGGVLRDVLVNRKPVVLTDEVYVLPSVLAASVVVAAPALGWSTAVVALPAVLLCTVIRMLAIQRHWHGPAVR